MPSERLDKVISSVCGASRKQSKEIIRSGRVRVGGRVAEDIDLKVDTSAPVEVDGTELYYNRHVYIMLNKPAGVLSASNGRGRRTVVDIVSETCRRSSLFPVGRLDKDTTGLIIITDDGDFAHRVISPKSMVEKEYIAEVDKPVSDDDIKLFEGGVTLADKTACRPARVYTVSDDRMTVGIVLTEGKYHEIKRMFGVAGIGVNRLRRIRIGSLCLDGALKTGMYRDLTPGELSAMWELLK